MAPEPPGDLLQEVVQEVLGRIRAVAYRLVYGHRIRPSPLTHPGSRQPLDRFAMPPSHGAIGDFEDRGDLPGIELLQVPQDQHLAMLRLQPLQRRADSSPLVLAFQVATRARSRPRSGARPARSRILPARAEPAAPREGRSAARRADDGDAGRSAGSWPGLAARGRTGPAGSRRYSSSLRAASARVSWTTSEGSIRAESRRSIRIATS